MVYVQVALKQAIVPIVKSPTFTLAFNLTMFVALHAAVSVSSTAQTLTPHVIYATPIKEKVRKRLTARGMPCAAPRPPACSFFGSAHPARPSRVSLVSVARLPAILRAQRPPISATCQPSPKFSSLESGRYISWAIQYPAH